MSEDQPHGQAGEPPPAPQRKIVAGFEILSKVGRGGMGAVFKARQITVDRIVALKVLPPNLAKDPTFTERFLREARSAAKLNHPNIVQAISAGQEGAYYYFAMEFVAGPTVARMLQSKGWLPERRALEIARDVARALEYAHNAGLVHRDIKPDNILVTADGTAKLADLGLAREIEQADVGVTQAGETLGTPNYISPEQIRGDVEIDGRADIYSLGATLYHMLVGEPPYAGPSGHVVMAKHLSDPVPDARKANREVSVAASAVIRKAMAKDPARRHSDAGAMLAEIERALGEPQHRAGRTPESKPKPKPKPAARARPAPQPERPRPSAVGNDTVASPAIRRRRRRRGAFPWILAAAVIVVLAVFALAAAHMAGVLPDWVPGPAGDQSEKPASDLSERPAGPSGPREAERKTVYLSDFKPASATVGWATLGMNRMPREMAPSGKCRCRGREFTRYICAHAPSRVVYRLPEGARRFTALVGLSDTSGGHGSVAFVVVGDGRTLFKSAVLTGTSKPVPVDVDVTGIKQLELVCDQDGGGQGWDHSVWFEPRLEITN